MADPYHHALSSVKKWGGTPEDYLKVHKWFDATKQAYCDQRHRALLHNAFGIELSIQVFGQVVTTSTGRKVPMRWIGEQHITEDCGFVPSVQDYLQHLKAQPWMLRGARTFSRTVNLLETLEPNGQ